MTKLKKLNTLLTILIIAINSYILLMPLYPMLNFWWRGHTTQQQSTLTKYLEPNPPPLPDGKHIIIPSMLLNEEIHEGPNIYTANKGIWRLPHTSTPDKGSNTVLVGHRFTYRGASVLYHLDKIKIDDQIAIVWNKQKFTYVVKGIKVVPPNDKSVEAPTENERLTIYTCTPMWSDKHRLVVVAERISQ